MSRDALENFGHAEHLVQLFVSCNYRIRVIEMAGDMGIFKEHVYHMLAEDLCRNESYSY